MSTNVISRFGAAAGFCVMVIAATSEKGTAQNTDTPSAMEVRAAVSTAVAHLRTRARKDTAGFFLPPGRTRKVVDHKEVTFRYREVDVPHHAPIYETYETVAAVSSGSSVGAAVQTKKVTRRRIVGWEKKGTRTVLRRDPSGPIERTERVPVWGSGGPDNLRPGWHAQNAMGVLVLLKAGVDPAELPLAQSIQSLADYTEGFGLPDRTLDLAWLTAAFVNLPKDNQTFRTLSERMVNKLLLAQIPDGPGAGMWGPVSLSPEYVAAMIKVEQALAEEHLVEWEERLRRTGDKEKYGPRIAEGRKIIDDFHQHLVNYSRKAVAFDDFERRSGRRDFGRYEIAADDKVRARSDWQLSPAAYRYRLALSPYVERTADIESTALVLFALREAEKNDYLPDAPFVPKGLDDEPAMPVVSTPRILNRAAQALVRRQAANGTFTQSLSWQPVTVFEEIGVSATKPRPPENLPDRSELTLLSTMQGYIAMADAATLLGQNGNQYKRNLASSQAVVKEMIAGLIEGETRGLEVGEDALALYEFAFFAGRLLDTGVGSTGEGRELWWDLTGFLLNKRRNNEDIWQTGKDRVFSPSVDAVLAERERRDAEQWVKSNAEDAKQYDNPVETKQSHIRRGSFDKWGVHFDETVPATTYASLLLLQGARPPAMGVWSWHGKSTRTATIEPVLQKLGKDYGIQLNFIELSPELPASHTFEIPILFASGAGAFKPAAADRYADNLASFLEHDGILLAEAPANEQGEAFLQPLKKKILELVPGSESVTVPAGRGLPEIEGVKGPNGRMISALLRIGRPGADNNTMSPAQAMQFVYDLLKARLDEESLRPDHAVDWALVEQVEGDLVE